MYGWLVRVYLVNYICSVVSITSLGGDFINYWGSVLSIKKTLEYPKEDRI